MNMSTLENYADIIKYIIFRYGYINMLKHIKSLMITIKKLLGISRDDFLDQMIQIQQYLQLLHSYFDSITELNDIEFKDVFM